MRVPSLETCCHHGQIPDSVEKGWSEPSRFWQQTDLAKAGNGEKEQEVSSWLHPRAGRLGKPCPAPDQAQHPPREGAQEAGRTGRWSLRGVCPVSWVRKCLENPACWSRAPTSRSGNTSGLPRGAQPLGCGACGFGNRGADWLARHGLSSGRSAAPGGQTDWAGEAWAVMGPPRVTATRGPPDCTSVAVKPCVSLETVSMSQKK